jgi:hypothetical protein
MNWRETFHPARLAGFAVGIVAGIGCILMGIDAHQPPSEPGRVEAEQARALHPS